MTTTGADPLETAWARWPNDALAIDDDAPASRCRSRKCQAPIWHGVTKAGRSCPFDIKPNGDYTGTSHWRTCLDREMFSKPKQ